MLFYIDLFFYKNYYFNALRNKFSPYRIIKMRTAETILIGFVQVMFKLTMCLSPKKNLLSPPTGYVVRLNTCRDQNYGGRRFEAGFPLGLLF